ncbi:MAG: SulP family inorganic anion transporter [Blastocatellia bacterium]
MKKIITFAFLRNDMMGGITAGIVALPLALAFGVQSGLGATAGLYGAIIIGIVAALVGGTAQQVSGPTGPMTVVSSLVVANAIAQAGNLEAALGTILLTFFLAGVFEMLIGVFRVGGYIRYMPHPVISGFMSGIGVVIILLQIYPLLGHTSPGSIAGIFTGLAAPLAAVNWAAVGITIATILIIYLFPRLTSAVPSALVALLAATVGANLLQLPAPLIGEIPGGPPTLQLSLFGAISFGGLYQIVGPAMTLAALGAIDSLLTSVIADNLSRTRHNSNQELIGQGLGNMAAALFGGIPGAGATMRTVVNIRAGGKTTLSGVIHGLFLLAVLLGLGRYTALIPKSVLAGILITVGVSIIDFKGLRALRKIPRHDAIIMVLVLVVTVAVDLLLAVAIGMVLASLFFMKRMSDLADLQLEKTLLRETELPDEEGLFDEKDLEKIFIKHLSGPFFFGFISKFRELVSQLPDVRVVIMRMEEVPFIDQSGVVALEDAVIELETRGIQVVMTGLRPQPLDRLIGLSIVPDLIAHQHLFADIQTAAAWAKQFVRPETT